MRDVNAHTCTATLVAGRKRRSAISSAFLRIPTCARFMPREYAFVYHFTYFYSSIVFTIVIAVYRLRLCPEICNLLVVFEENARSSDMLRYHMCGVTHMT